MTTQRDLSLDAFRGLTVLLMIIVNIQGNGDAAYAALKHAEWHGLTFADLVFPWFLFIVGLSVPLALDRAHSGSPWPQVIRRTLLLFALGVILSWLIRPVEFGQIRWMGVLQRIAFVYLACAALLLWTRGWVTAAAMAGAALLLHSWLLFVAVDGVNSLTEGAGLNAALDQQWLPGRLLRKTWDPEGVLSTLPAIGSGLLGVAAMRSGLDGRRNTGLGLTLLLGGALLSLIIPVNKALWTASFVLITAGLALLLWMVMRRVWQSHWRHAVSAAVRPARPDRADAICHSYAVAGDHRAQTARWHTDLGRAVCPAWRFAPRFRLAALCVGCRRAVRRPLRLAQTQRLADKSIAHTAFSKQNFALSLTVLFG